MDDDTCIRCGMCCLVSPCTYSGVEERYGGNCSYLTVNDNNTTTCHNKDANEAFIGSGCLFQRQYAAGVYKAHISEYAIKERKQTLKRCYHDDKNRVISQ